MFTPGFVHILLILLIIVICLIGFAIRRTIKKVSYLVYSLAIISIILILTDFFTNPAWIVKAEEEAAGIYTIDIESSIYDKVILSRYQNTQLHVKPDHTFEIEGNNTLFGYRACSWKIKDDGDISYIDCDCQVAKFILFYNKEKWVFTNEGLRTGKYGDQIVFIKK